VFLYTCAYWHSVFYLHGLKESRGRRISTEIREILVAERARKGLSLNQLAELAGVDRVSLGRFETGDFPVSGIFTIRIYPLYIR